MKNLTVETARQFLTEQGYYTENLWHVDDVMSRYECDEETAQQVLHEALANDATIEQTFLSIEYSADYNNLKSKH